MGEPDGAANGSQPRAPPRDRIGRLRGWVKATTNRRSSSTRRHGRSWCGCGGKRWKRWGSRSKRQMAHLRQRRRRRVGLSH